MQRDTHHQERRCSEGAFLLPIHHRRQKSISQSFGTLESWLSDTAAAAAAVSKLGEMEAADPPGTQKSEPKVRLFFFATVWQISRAYAKEPTNVLGLLELFFAENGSPPPSPPWFQAVAAIRLLGKQFQSSRWRNPNFCISVSYYVRLDLLCSDDDDDDDSD